MSQYAQDRGELQEQSGANGHDHKVSEVRQIILRIVEKGKNKKIKPKKRGIGGVKAIFFDYDTMEKCATVLGYDPKHPEQRHPGTWELPEDDTDPDPDQDDLNGRTNHPLCYFDGSVIYCP